MAFTVKLQNNTSEANKLVKNVSDVLSVTGTLKEGTSVIDPVIMVETDTPPVGVNYMTIDTFGRKYFIKDIKNVNNKLWEIYGHVDVLYTYANQIKACSGVVAKQENNYNLYLNDTDYKCYSDPYVETMAFPSGFNTYQFVLACVGSYQTPT